MVCNVFKVSVTFCFIMSGHSLLTRDSPDESRTDVNSRRFLNWLELQMREVCGYLDYSASAARPHQRGDRITALFAAVHRSRLAHSVIRGTATFWQLLGQSGHAEPVLANLKR